MTDYVAVLSANYPDAQWTLSGNDYATLIWHDDTPKPSQAELDAAWPAVQQAQADAVAAKETARQSAINKLAALGLTVDEISAAFGLENN
jgi:DNA-binding NarL/FixJ family response regulator